MSNSCKVMVVRKWLRLMAQTFSGWLNYVSRQKMLHVTEERLKRRAAARLMADSFCDMVEIIQVRWIRVMMFACACDA